MDAGTRRINGVNTYRWQIQPPAAIPLQVPVKTVFYSAEIGPLLSMTPAEIAYRVKLAVS